MPQEGWVELFRLDVMKGNSEGLNKDLGQDGDMMIIELLKVAGTGSFQGA